MITADSLKTRLANGEVCKGTFALFSAGGDFALFLAGLGFDYFILDLEHSMFDLSKTRETILAARAAGVATIVRIPEIAYHFAGRSLDAGATGLMLPRMETREEAEMLVRFSRYPPEGERGISTFAGHNDFSRLPDVPAFLKRRNEEVMLIAQIESVKGVENREAILSTPGLDACFVGTGDLAMSMGYAGQPNHPEVLAQAATVIATARLHRLIVSLPIRAPEDVAYWINRDMKMLTLASDGSFFTLGANLFFKEIAAGMKQSGTNKEGGETANRC
jgi:2-keto-3-deoxy-L-rhamnonate aldolase RhmA